MSSVRDMWQSSFLFIIEGNPHHSHSVHISTLGKKAGILGKSIADVVRGE